MRTIVFAAAAGVAAGCASLGSYDVYDGGRAQRAVEEAPIDSAKSSERVLAEPTIRLADGPIRRSGGESVRVRDKLCDADGWSHLIGTEHGDIPTDKLPEPYRVVGPNDLITQDFLPSRLNLYLDSDGKVYRVSCG